MTERSTGNGDIGLSGLTLTASGTGVLGTLGTLGINRTTARSSRVLVDPLLLQIDTQLSARSPTCSAPTSPGPTSPRSIDCDFGNVKLVG